MLGWKGEGSERYTAQRRADHRDPEARGSRGRDGGVMSTARDQRADLLPLEGEVRWNGQQRSETAEATGRREPQTEARGGGADVG